MLLRRPFPARPKLSARGKKARANERSKLSNMSLEGAAMRGGRRPFRPKVQPKSPENPSQEGSAASKVKSLPCTVRTDREPSSYRKILSFKISTTSQAMKSCTVSQNANARSNRAIKYTFKLLLGGMLTGILTTSAFGQATNLFTDGEGSSTYDQYPGIADAGWAEGWNYQFGVNSGFSGFFGVDPHVISTTPLFAGGGNYFNWGMA